MSARIAAIAALVPPGEGLVVDVGADHGRVAAALAAAGRAVVATERRPERRGASDVAWVVADGLRPFAGVEGVIVAGMGWRTITRILSTGARPRWAVLHADDEPGSLNRWLAAHGWRLAASALVEAGGRFARVVRADPGVERSTGLELAYDPNLLARRDPTTRRWLEAERARQVGIATAAGERPSGADARAHVAFLDARLGLWGGGSPGYGGSVGS